jgi:hypothetical protein
VRQLKGNTVTYRRLARPSRWLFGAALLGAASAGTACGKKTDPTQAHFEEGMRAYLERRGDLCLAKYEWPIDVSAHDAAVGTRDALQMPVLERLGLVRSSDFTINVNRDDGVVPVDVKRYELTEAGLADFRSREVGVNPAGEKLVSSDFCVAKLSLDKVVGWEVHGGAGPGDSPRAVISYTYAVASDPWTHDPEIQRVLPAVARVIAGAGTATLEETFALRPEGWVAVDLVAGDGRIVSNPLGPKEPKRPAAPGNP